MASSAPPATSTSSFCQVKKRPCSLRCPTILGAPLEGLDHTDLLIDDEHFKLVTSDNSVDVLTSIGGMPFDEIWNNRIDVEVEGVPVHFISKADLIENKRQVSRYLDLADVEELQRFPLLPPLDLPNPPAK